MYKIADSKEKYDKCADYLKKKDIAHFDGTVYFYVESKGEIQAIAGYNPNFGSVIEPFASESPFYAMNLFSFVTGYLVAKGYDCMSVITEDQRVIKILKRYGFGTNFGSRLFFTNKL